MPEESKDKQTTFDASYVSELREENAKWRTKVRDLESKFDNMTLKTTLEAEGIQAEPSWVNRREDQSIEDAVKEFKGKYPHLVKSPVGEGDTQGDNQGNAQGNTQGNIQGETKPERKSIPPAQKPSVSTTPRGERSLSELKKDPKARERIRDQYRELLRQ